MEKNETKKLSHRDWRKIAKRERRRKIRKESAKLRDDDELRLKKTLEKSADYLKWVEDEIKIEEERKKLEQEEHERAEKLWLKNEEEAQEEFKIIQEKRANARQEQLHQEELIRKEFEAHQKSLKKKREEAKNRQEQEIKRIENIEKEISDYIDNGAKTPEILREVTDSQPGKELCSFFSKTAACKYGEACSRNHRRYALSKIILIPGFYNHFSLEKTSVEYDTDIHLEFEKSETSNDYRKFYYDIESELKTFGHIKTLKCCYNSENHLRGNLYVEYKTEREAARAARKLKGRFYAGRQLNCEFAYFTSWRSAVCGVTNCPKGRRCNFLHTYRNPSDNYDIESPPRWLKKEKNGTSRRNTERRDETPRAESTRNNSVRRWSSSPGSRRESRKSERSKSRISSSKEKKRKSIKRSRSRERDKSLSENVKSSERSKKHKHRDKENEKNHRSSKRSRNESESTKSKKKKSQKSKWDECEKVNCLSSDSSHTDQHSSTKIKLTENSWDTTDSEEETLESDQSSKKNSKLMLIDHFHPIKSSIKLR